MREAAEIGNTLFLAGTGSPPVFLHSSFRTSSTWLWTRFRADGRALAYNEVFNDLLARLTPGAALTHDPASWRSGHPPTEPYFLEFVPLIVPPRGVRLYDPAMALERYLPQGGAGGDVSAPERAYVASLIEHARNLGRVPVLSDTRTLARLPGLKRAFGGHHIFLCRNLFHQWNSYVTQQYAGNPFFVATVVEVLQCANGDDYVEFLAQTMRAASGFSVDHWLRPQNHASLFTVFCGLHLYLSMIACQTADLIIDVDRIGASPSARIDVEREIAEACGLTVDLGDVRPVPTQPPAAWRGALASDGDAMWATIAVLFAEAVAAAGATGAAERFGRQMLDDAWRAARRDSESAAGGQRASGDAADDSLVARVSLAERADVWAKLLYHDPENVAVLDRLGRLRVAQGRLDDALALSARAIRLVPQSPAALLHHADVLAALNRHEQAKKFRAHAAAIDRDG
jgi:hypothetical protein